MRVVWKDSHVRKYHSYDYRGYTITPYGETGYITNIEGDSKIYSGRVSAFNAIDEYLGGTGQRGDAKRRERGIKVLGNVTETA